VSVYSNVLFSLLGLRVQSFNKGPATGPSWGLPLRPPNFLLLRLLWVSEKFLKCALVYFVQPLCFLGCSWCFLFFLARNLRAPSADHRETSPHDRNRCQFYKLTPKIRVAPPLPSPKNGAKDMQNFGRFCTTSDFDREYLRNGSRYPKTES